MTGATDLIAAERERQISEEGYDEAHDAEHTDELAMAGASYALFTHGERVNVDHEAMLLWPWDMQWWKPTNRIRNLTKAGALIAAALDEELRLDAERVALDRAGQEVGRDG